MSVHDRTPRDPVLDELFNEPWRFEFPQAMRVLLRNSEHGNTALPEDRRYDVAREPVRIGAHQSLGFPASDIQALQARTDPVTGADQRAGMLINFLGLTGPSGVLPVVYTEFMMGWVPDKEDLRVPVDAVDFFDIFNHRMAMLFYYAWEKYRFPVVRERRPDHDFFNQMLLSLAGLGTEYLQHRHFTSDAFFAKYASLLAIQPRSASALETILASDFNVPIEVKQFQGAWYPLDENSTTRFPDFDSDSERLGYGVVVSEEYWTQEFGIRICIGPLDMKDYKRFMPEGPGLERIREICRFYSRDEMAFDVQLILMRSQVPATRLSGGAASDDNDSNDSQLGWTTWARSIDEDPEDYPEAKPSWTMSVPFADDVRDVVIRLS